MTKEEWRKFCNLPKEREYYERRIKTLERKANAVPIVKDKVQSSQKEWPYIQTHETVDAPQPQQYTKIQRELRRYRILLERTERTLDELTSILAKIEDARARQILVERYVEGRKLIDLAIKYDMTEQGIIKIINKTIEYL